MSLSALQSTPEFCVEASGGLNSLNMKMRQKEPALNPFGHSPFLLQCKDMRVMLILNCMKFLKCIN